MKKKEKFINAWKLIWPKSKQQTRIVQWHQENKSDEIEGKQDIQQRIVQG